MGQPQPEQPLDGTGTLTPDPSVRALIAQWRESAAQYLDDSDDDTHGRDKARGEVQLACAKQLEAALKSQDTRLADLEAEMRRFAAIQLSINETAVARQALAWAERLKAL